jgi:hypothetical protein
VTPPDKESDRHSFVSDSPIPLFRWLDFFVGLSANASRPRDYAARRSAERCAAQPQGMSSSRRDAGQRLTPHSVRTKRGRRSGSRRQAPPIGRRQAGNRPPARRIFFRRVKQSRAIYSVGCLGELETHTLPPGFIPLCLQSRDCPQNSRGSIIFTSRNPPATAVGDFITRLDSAPLVIRFGVR